MPVARRPAGLAARGGRRRHPPRRPGRAGPRLAQSPVRQRAEELGIEVLTPRPPARPRVPGPAARARAGLLPGGGLRRADPAGGARHPARTAGSTCTSPCCPPGAAPRPCSTPSWPATRSPAPRPSCIEAGSTPGRCFGMMTETDPAPRHRRRPARPAGRGRGRPARRHDGRPRRRLADAGAAAGRRASRWRPRSSVEDARVRWDRPAVAVDRQVRGCTPAPGAWSTFRGERVKLAARRSPTRAYAGPRPRRPGELAAGQARGARGHAPAAPVRLGEVRPHGKKPMAAADWARGVRIEAGERFGHE